MAPCPETDSLRRMLSGELTEAEATDVEGHVGVCPRCQAAVEALLGTWDARPDAGATAPSYLQRLSPATTAEMPPLPQAPPPELPGYEILGELGRGGMGVVYLARRASLDRLAAIKLMLGGSHAGWQARARFQAEAKVVARLQHANIVGIYHVGEHDGLPFLEMEYLAGGSLAATLKGTPLRPGQAAGLVEPLALGMAEAHRTGILHRDLKPGNVLLAADGTPKVADFGLAKLLDQDSGVTQSGAIMGSPSYMAPEQAEGRTVDVGPPTDVYALGAILYEALTGRPPFRGASPVETLQQVRSVEPIPPSRLAPDLPRDLETIALKCLEKDPSRRYPTARELADDLRRFLDGLPIRARPAGAGERAWKWARRRPAVAALATVSLAATVLLIGLGVYYNTRLVRSNADLTQALDRAREAEREAAANAKSSAEQRDLALKTLNTLVYQVQDKLGREPKTRPLQKELLEEAIKGLSEQAKSAKNSAPDASRAAAHYKLAQVFLEVGRHDESREEAGQAAAVAEALIESGKADGEVRALAGRSRSHLGEMLLNADKPDAAIEEFARGLRFVEGRPAGAETAILRLTEMDLLTRMLAAHVWKRAAQEARGFAGRLDRLAAEEFARAPDDLKVRNEVTSAWNGLARHAEQLPDLPRAFDLYRRSIELGRRILAVAPKDPDARMSVYVDLNNLATLLVEQGDREGALAAFRESITMLEGMRKDDPDDPRFTLNMANNRANLAFVLLELSRFEEALQEYRTALAEIDRKEVARQFEANAGYQEVRPRILRFMAICEAAVKVVADPGVVKGKPVEEATFLLLHRARALSGRKDIPGLASTAGLIRDLPAETPRDRLEQAVACLACAGLLEAASRPDEARSCKDAARAAVTRVVASKPANLAELLARPSLAPLRKDPELGKLIGP